MTEPDLDSDEINVLNSLDEGAALLDKNGAILWVNSALRSLMGYKKEELVGGCMSAFYTDNAKKCFEQTFKSAKNNGEADKTFLCEQPNDKHYREQLKIRKLNRVGFVCLKKDITKGVHTEEGLRHEAYYDDMTGLHNLSWLRRHLTRQHKKIGILLLDIKEFRGVNKTHGPRIGDRVLKRVSQIVSEKARGRDVARAGADSFAVLIDGADTVENARIIYNNINKEIDNSITIGYQTIPITIQAGVAIYPDHARRSSECLAKADIARKDGGEEFNIYDTAMSENARDIAKNRQLIRQGLENDEFILYYQPQIDLETGKIYGVEGLLRWEYKGEVYTPGSFLQYIDGEPELTKRITKRTLEIGANQLCQWEQADYDIQLSINVSSMMFNQELIQTLKKLYSRCSFPKNKFSVEITERTAAGDADKIAGVMDELNAMGVSTIIDDFGTGYSSLEYVADFPLEWLKIDKRYVMDIDNGTADLLESVLIMADRLDLSVIAEGVETARQEEFLKKRGCDYGQGFHYAKGRPASNLELKEQF